MLNISNTGLQFLKLNDNSIEDWCEEARSLHGFCPQELFIPQYKTNDDEYIHDTSFDNYLEFVNEPFCEDPQTTEINFHQFGFISGCVWMDDHRMKLRYADLSEISDKKFTISEKFGYWELPNNLPLKKCINLQYWDEGSISLIGEKTFHDKY